MPNQHITSRISWQPSVEELEQMLHSRIGDEKIAALCGVTRSAITKLRLNYGLSATGKRGNYPRLRGSRPGPRR